MNWENIIVTAINILGVGGVFTAILFYSENKRAKHLANETTAAQQQKELYDELRAENATLKDTATKKETIIEELRKERDAQILAEQETEQQQRIEQEQHQDADDILKYK